LEGSQAGIWDFLICESVETRFRPRETQEVIHKRIGVKLSAGYASIAGLLVIVVLVSSSLAGAMQDTMKELGEQEDIHDDLEQLESLVREQSTLVMRYVGGGGLGTGGNSSDNGAPPPGRDDVNVSLEDVEAGFISIESTISILQDSTSGRDGFQQELASYRLIVTDIRDTMDTLTLSENDTLDDALVLFGGIRQDTERILVGVDGNDSAGIDHLLVVQEEAIDDKESELELNAQYTMVTIGAGVTGAIVLAFFLSILMDMKIGRPIQQLTEIARKVVYDNDMDAFIRIESDDEIGELSDMYARLINTTKTAMSILEAQGGGQAGSSSGGETSTDAGE